MNKVKIEEEWTPKSNIYTRTWIPAGVPIATVTFIHGFGEHCSRYDHVFTPFAEAGIKVHSFDQRGFGKTGRKSGIIGHNETLAEVTKDIIEANKRVSMQGVPHFIMGHSMGGGLALKFASEHPEGLSGVIASAPLVGLAKAVSVPYLKKVAIQGLSAWIPWLTINQGINQKVLSRDPAVGKAYVEDPNVHSYISFGTANDLLTICDSLQANGIKKINIPVLIAHGTQDNLTCYETSKKFHDEHEHHDKEFLSLDGWFHELHNEPEYLIVVSKYIDWIKKHVK